MRPKQSRGSSQNQPECILFCVFFKETYPKYGQVVYNMIVSNYRAAAKVSDPVKL